MCTFSKAVLTFSLSSLKKNKKKYIFRFTWRYSLRSHWNQPACKHLKGKDLRSDDDARIYLIYFLWFLKRMSLFILTMNLVIEMSSFRQVHPSLNEAN